MFDVNTHTQSPAAADVHTPPQSLLFRREFAMKLERWELLL